jgi:molybdate transport system substrate-binding protein
MNQRHQFLCAAALVCCLSGGCGDRSAGPKDIPQPVMLSVAAASDLKFAFDEIAAEFHRQHSDVVVRPTYGSSGSFFAQLSNGAPFDLFLSADIQYPRQLIEQGQAIAESEFLYAVGHLVVWVKSDSPIDIEERGIRALTDPGVRKIAIANPKLAPYGRAAEAALQHFEIYNEVHDRLVFGENVSQTAQFVDSGSADAGIIALSLALSPTMKERGRYWPVPLEAHPPLEQGGVILKETRRRAECDELRAFLTSPSGRSIFRRYGFELPEQ